MSSSTFFSAEKKTEAKPSSESKIQAPRITRSQIKAVLDTYDKNKKLNKNALQSLLIKDSAEMAKIRYFYNHSSKKVTCLTPNLWLDLLRLLQVPKEKLVKHTATAIGSLRALYGDPEVLQLIEPALNTYQISCPHSEFYSNDLESRSHAFSYILNYIAQYEDFDAIYRNPQFAAKIVKGLRILNESSLNHDYSGGFGIRDSEDMRACDAPLEMRQHLYSHPEIANKIADALFLLQDLMIPVEWRHRLIERYPNKIQAIAIQLCEIYRRAQSESDRTFWPANFVKEHFENIENALKKCKQEKERAYHAKYHSGASEKKTAQSFSAAKDDGIEDAIKSQLVDNVSALGFLAKPFDDIAAPVTKPIKPYVEAAEEIYDALSFEF